MKPFTEIWRRNPKICVKKTFQHPREAVFKAKIAAPLVPAVERSAWKTYGIPCPRATDGFALIHSGTSKFGIQAVAVLRGKGEYVAEITILLRRWEAGEADALERLIPLIYPQLRQIAAAYMGREKRKDLMQATVLVHELYLKLLRQRSVAWEDRRHFYVFAASSMRRILIDHARAQQAQSRGSGLAPVSLHEAMAWVEIGSPELIELDRALEELQTVAPDKVRLVEMRYFLGCTADETAALLNVSKATVDRELRFVKAWLFQRLYPEPKSIQS